MDTRNDQENDGTYCIVKKKGLGRQGTGTTPDKKSVWVEGFVGELVESDISNTRLEIERDIEDDPDIYSPVPASVVYINTKHRPHSKIGKIRRTLNRLGNIKDYMPRWKGFARAACTAAALAFITLNGPSCYHSRLDDLISADRAGVTASAEATEGLDEQMDETGEAYGGTIDNRIPVTRAHELIEEDIIEDANAVEQIDPHRYTRQEISNILSAGVPIIMYHKIESRSGFDRYNVSPSELRSQLERLYRAGFTLISIEDLVDEDLSSVPLGRKPLVITLDDAEKGQFAFLERNGRVVLDRMGNPVLDPDCFFAILKEFYRTHPDFGFEATFFVDFVNNQTYEFEVPFGQQGYEGLKLNRIIGEGLSIGNHTYSHINMSRSSRETINKELGRLMDVLEDYLGDDISQVNTIAFPYGALPDGLNRSIFTVNYNGRTYRFDAAMHAWGGVAYPNSPLYRIPRIETNTDTFSSHVLNRGMSASRLSAIENSRGNLARYGD